MSVNCSCVVDRYSQHRSDCPLHVPVVPVASYHSGKNRQLSTTEAFEEFGRAWDALAQELRRVVNDLFAGPTDTFVKQLRSHGLIEDPGPEDPMERALWLKRHRSTGPSRPSGQAAHRPRRHQ